jgi:hypothetical protein
MKLFRMDAETIKLLEELKVAIKDSKKPFFSNIIQSVLIAGIIAIPTVITIGNKYENRIIKIEDRQAEISDEFRRKEFKIDFNFRLIESKDQTLKFIPITE